MGVDAKVLALGTSYFPSSSLTYKGRENRPHFCAMGSDSLPTGHCASASGSGA